MALFENVTLTDVKEPFTVFFAQGKTLRMQNRENYAISLCVNGQITYTHKGQTFVSKPDVAVLLPKGETYEIRGDREGLFPLINFECDNLDVHSFYLFKNKNPQGFVREYQTIKDYALAGERLRAFGAFYDLLAHLDADQEKKNPYLSRADAVIQKAIGDPSLSNRKLAEELGISEVYLRKLFRTYCAVTPKQYVLEQRLQKAKQLLLNTRDTVSAVAEACGFSSVYRFCRFFKDKTGQTPSDFARQNRMYHL